MKHLWQILLTRRSLLRRFTATVLLLAGGRILWRVFLPGRIGPSERERLAAVLDTLIPDGEFPGARQTGVLDALIAECEPVRQSRRAVVEGLALLDQQARRFGADSFASLTTVQREAALLECAAAEPGSLPWFFFRTVRDGAMRLHYSHPLAWRAVGLSHPPQPQGYADYTQAPRV